MSVRVAGPGTRDRAFQHLDRDVRQRERDEDRETELPLAHRDE